MSGKIVVIGCGASGLICAIVCARAGLEVDIYEQNKECAKKILVSGNGKCNIANVLVSQDDFFANNSAVVQSVLKRFGYREIKRFFGELGLLLIEKEDGRVFPFSQEAKSVVEILTKSALELGVNIYTQTAVQKLQSDLGVVVSEQTRRYDAVVLATGSKAAQHLGGNESGYDMAKECGHEIAPLYPALVQLVTSSKLPKLMSGVRMECEATLYINGIKEQTLRGDVLFGDYGLSGLVILDLSLLASRALHEGAAVDVELNLLHRLDANKAAKHLVELARMHPTYSLFTILHTLLPKKITNALLKELGLENRSLALDMKLAKRIVHKAQRWRFEIEDTKGFRYAEVCGGGVNSHEIDAGTFESKKKENLYIVGEVLDVVGRRGGYNFIFAWGSGYLAGCDIIRKINKKG